MKKSVKYHLWPAIIAAVIVVLATALWNNRASVIWFETAELVHEESGVVRMHVTAYKPRGCALIPDSQVGYIMIGGLWEESGFIFVNDATPGNSKPPSFGRISFGVWEWYDAVPPPEKISSVMTTVSHDCGSGEFRTTKIGPFDI